MKFDEMKDLNREADINLGRTCENTPGKDELEGYLLEQEIVQGISCNPEQPLCLYDFTIKHVMTDYIAYALPNLLDIQQNEHFYEEDYKNVKIHKTRYQYPKVGSNTKETKEFYEPKNL